MADNDSRSGARYADPDIVRYTNGVHAGHDAALARAFDAPDAHEMPAIQLGASEGRLLQMLCGLVGARRAVEVGTLAGYSALHIARGMGREGRLWTVEFDPRHAEVARSNIADAGLDDRIEVCVGPALDVLPTLTEHGPFDVVFIDADKGNYDRYGRWARENLRPGGLLIADNAFFFGKLLDDRPDAAAVRRMHEEVAEAFDSVCVPTPDGMVVGVRR
jgi:predicted O-methyltransferase YrrM